jgi:hypothetical protein
MKNEQCHPHLRLIVVLGFLFSIASASNSTVGKSTYGLSREVTGDMCTHVENAPEASRMTGVALGFSVFALGVIFLAAWIMITDSASHNKMPPTHDTAFLIIPCICCGVIPLVIIAAASGFNFVSVGDLYQLLWIPALITAILMFLFLCTNMRLRKAPLRRAQGTYMAKSMGAVELSSGLDEGLEGLEVHPGYKFWTYTRVAFLFVAASFATSYYLWTRLPVEVERSDVIGSKWAWSGYEAFEGTYPYDLWRSDNTLVGYYPLPDSWKEVNINEKFTPDVSSDSTFKDAFVGKEPTKPNFKWYVRSAPLTLTAGKFTANVTVDYDDVAMFTLIPKTGGGVNNSLVLLGQADAPVSPPNAVNKAKNRYFTFNIPKTGEYIFAGVGIFQGDSITAAETIDFTMSNFFLQGSCCKAGYYTTLNSTDFQCVACPAMQYCPDGVATLPCPSDGTVENQRTALKSTEECKMAGRYTFYQNMNGTKDATPSYRQGGNALLLDTFSYFDLSKTTSPLAVCGSEGVYFGLMIGVGVLMGCCLCFAIVAASESGEAAFGFICMCCVCGLVPFIISAVYYSQCDAPCNPGNVSLYVVNEWNNDDQVFDNNYTLCTFCPDGYFCDQTHHSTASLCPAGKFGNGSLLTAESQCATCPAGRFKPGGGIFCKDCSQTGPGVYAAAGVTDSPTSCSSRDCPLGHRCPAQDSVKIACLVGKYQDSTKQSTCKTCPAGTTCTTEGSTIATSCPRGYFCPDVNQEPKLCPNDKYQDQLGQTSCKPCTSNPGQYCSSNTGQNVDCPKGYYCPGNSQAIACETGFYKNSTGAGTCKACPSKGYDCGTPGTVLPVLCAPGHYCINGTSTKCALGQYQNESNSTSCKPCPALHTCGVLGTITPMLCPRGSFCPSNGSGIAFSCPANEYQNELGQSSCKSDCDLTKDNFISPNKDKCTSCTSGSDHKDNFPLATCDCPVGMTKFSENATYCCPALYSGDRCEDNSLFIISLVLAFLFSVSVIYIVYVDCSMPEDKNMILYSVFMALGDFQSDVFLPDN